MKCTQNLGGIVAPSSGVLGGIAEGALIVWKDAEIVAAIAAAKEAGMAAGIKAGEAAGATRLIELIQSTFKIKNIAGEALGSFINPENYTSVSIITEALSNDYLDICIRSLPGSLRDVGVRYNSSSPICTFVEVGMVAKNAGTGGSPKNFIETYVQSFVSQAETTAEMAVQKVTKDATTTLTAQKTGAINTIFMSKQTAIIASVVAILKKKNEEKTRIYKTIRRIDVMYLVFFDVGRINTTNTMNSKNSQHITKYNNYT
ncbi:hypothetical protein PFHG_05282 [Plasmodium falciparum HB3]|uniref:Rifin n=1 Tax=Plasmodium falciparum (isolate HB3) TaxID=137071 RepID=A0A0L7KJM4_PLAFX|nr:hypothetical protein PFHG_05282 [Plasmodium falciparum HB3]